MPYPKIITKAFPRNNLYVQVVYDLFGNNTMEQPGLLRKRLEYHVGKLKRGKTLSNDKEEKAFIDTQIRELEDILGGRVEDTDTGRSLGDFSIHDFVQYIPPHAANNSHHVDCKRGVVTGLDELDGKVRVTFGLRPGQAIAPKFLIII